MKKIIVIIFTIFIVNIVNAQVKKFSGTFEEAKVAAKNSGKILLVNCTSPKGCVPCARVENKFLPDKKVGDLFNKNFIFLDCPTGGANNKLVESLYTTSGHPTFLYLDGDGKLIARFSGAPDKVDEFIDMVKFYAKNENSLKSQKEKFLRDDSYGDQYLKYLTNAYLNDKVEFALNIMFNRLMGDKNKQIAFLKKNIGKYTLFYFKDINGSIFNYMFYNKDEFKRMLNIDDTQYFNDISGIIGRTIRNMLGDFNYSEKDYNKILEVFKKYPKIEKYNKLMFSALKPAKEKGLDGIVEVYEKEVFKLSPKLRLRANHLFYWRFFHYMDKNVRLRNYIERCYNLDKQTKEGKTYKRMLGLNNK